MKNKNVGQSRYLAGTKYQFSVLIILVILLSCSPKAWSAATGSQAKQWVAAGDMISARRGHSTTPLLSGKILATGGDDLSSVPQSSAEIYDIQTDTWSAIGNMVDARSYHTATPLPDGKVVIIGGVGKDNHQPLNSVEIYDSTNNTWSFASRMAEAHIRHSATLLANGKILVVGLSAGNNQISAELYDSKNNNWVPAGGLITPRSNHTATLLKNGKVLVVGGNGPNNEFITSSEIYDNDSDKWSVGGEIVAGRVSHTSTMLNNGDVLVVGGLNSDNIELSAVELYSSASGSGTWRVVGGVTTARCDHTATRLLNGNVVVTGGTKDGKSVSFSEVYDSSVELWKQIDPMITERNGHSSVLLLNGKILVTGGVNNGVALFESEQCNLSLGMIKPMAVPDIPTGVSATAGDAQVSVSFGPPISDGGKPILSYEVVSNPVTATVTGTSSPILVTGLTNGNGYVFTVVAINADGKSLTSVPSNIVVPRTIPSSPIIGTATAYNGRVDISFSVPTTNGGATIDYYTATSTPGGNIISGSTSPLSFLGLTPGTSYTFVVTATNIAGTSPPSAVSNAAVPYMLPGAVQNIVATASNGQATITFNAPSSDGYLPLTQYKAVSSPGGIVAIVAAPASSITMSSLTNGQAYSFTLYAYNSMGPGPGTTSNVVTPGALPGSPSITSVTGGDGQVTIVFSPPASDGGNAIIKYTATSSPGNFVAEGAHSPLTVNGLTNGVNYTFTVKATNAVGAGLPSASSALVFPHSVPGPPVIGTAVAGNSQAVVNFSVPINNGGSPVTGYIVSTSPATSISVGNSSPITVTGLNNGIAYTFKVAATSIYGQGQFSGASNSVVPSTLPGAPGITSISIGSGKTSIYFSSTVDNGYPITDYTVMIRDLSGTLQKTQNGATSPIIVQGLTLGAAYTATISAINASGTGPASPSVNFTYITEPNAPSVVTAKMLGNSVEISFIPPSGNGGSAITGYKVISNPGVISLNGRSTPIILSTGFKIGTSYTFTVVAMNSAGQSVPSSATLPLVYTTPPDAPTAIVATMLSGGTVSVAFKAPVNNGGATITNYHVTTTTSSITGSGGASPIQVSNLMPNSVYKFLVTAENANGIGKAGVSNSVTGYTTPGVPTKVLATIAGTNAIIRITPPLSNGGIAITSYIVSSNTGNFVVSGARSPITVSGLIPGTSYSFTAVAKNLAGNGLSSAASNTVVAYGIPGAPRNVTATAGGKSATITFVQPIDDGKSPIIRYKITSHPGNISKLVAASPAQVTGFIVGQAYTFSVQAYNAAGYGPATDTTTAVTPYLPPPAPTSIVATPTDKKVTISFVPPAAYTYATVTGYVVTTYPGGVQTSGTSSPITVNNLTNGLAYNFTVRTVCSLGPGIDSALTVKVVPAAPPGAPTAVIVTSGPASASVSFKPPTETGGMPVTGYVATAELDGVVVGTILKGASPLTFKGLTNGLTYNISVSAVSKAGVGTPSEPISVLPCTVPSVVPKVTATAGYKTATISFDTPADTGGSPISGYRVVSNKSNFTAKIDSSPVTIADLPAGVPMSFYVYAINSAGESKQSLASAVVTPYAEPGTPTIGVATAGKNQAIVRFSSPASNGGKPITSYTVTSYPGGGVGTGITGPITVTGLTAGVNYTFTVVATNEIGSSTSSLASNSVTPF